MIKAAVCRAIVLIGNKLIRLIDQPAVSMQRLESSDTFDWEDTGGLNTGRQ